MEHLCSSSYTGCSDMLLTCAEFYIYDKMVFKQSLLKESTSISVSVNVVIENEHEVL